MNPKLTKVTRDIERTKEKITELQASVPVLEKQKTELENAELIKVFRSAKVAAEDFAAFIEACKAGIEDSTLLPVQSAPPISKTEELSQNTEAPNQYDEGFALNRDDRGFVSNYDNGGLSDNEE